jgi:hypothetical protein
MTRTRRRFRFLLPVVAAASVLAMSPGGAFAQDNQRQTQPTPVRPGVIVEQVENGPAFGAEFKYTQVNGRDAYLLGGFGGAVYDNTLLIGAAGYWQVNSDHMGGGLGYGGLLVEWYALRTPAIAFSARGLVGGGVATVRWSGSVRMPDGRHWSSSSPPGSVNRIFLFDQGYFLFEPQANVTVRLAPGVAMVGGVGYRVIGAASGFENQIRGFTASAAIRFSSKR